MTPAQRSQRARIASHASWARTPDRSARAAKGSAGLDERIAREYEIPADLPATEYAIRLASARKAYFGRLATLSAKARAARRGSAAA